MRIFPPGVGRRLLWAAAACVALPWTAGEWFKRWLQAGFEPDPLRAELMVDFIVAGTVFTALTLLLTVAVGCWVTGVMKGPHYTADSFPVDSPRRPEQP
ncbi:MAG TPA: hypothetical protein PL196_08690 [Burkholderiaceae bacterium]|nr:hypothetical protein [Burkholderiaceae bacterium]